VVCAVFVASAASPAREWRVASAAEFASVKASPADVIVWAAGRHADVVMRLKAEGTKAAPITVRAETPGGAVFTGASQLEAKGSWLVIEGLAFEQTSTDPIVLRDARNCRVTRCSVRGSNPEGKRIHWLRIGGGNSADNRVDGCTFEDKRGDGVMLVIDGEDGRIATGTRIDHNVFRGIVRAVRNGMEALRVGDSSFQELDAWTVVEENRFEDCRGDAEVVSNKSSANIYRRNAFIGCDGGAIVLRHGSRCVVEGNQIDGQGRPKSGGIRLHGEGHVVRGNTVERTGAFAISLPAGNSVPRPTGHAPVKNALIEGNRVLHPAGLIFVLGEPHDDKKRQDTAPTGVVFRGNEVEERGEQPLVKEFLVVPGGVRWE
jgi:poly(beta-D-mannuronate) lyase